MLTMIDPENTGPMNPTDWAITSGSDKTFAEMVPLGRHGTPEDVVGLVSFLLSDDSSYATGTTHSVDGGFTTA